MLKDYRVGELCLKTEGGCSGFAASPSPAPRPAPPGHGESEDGVMESKGRCRGLLEKPSVLASKAGAAAGAIGGRVCWWPWVCGVPVPLLPRGFCKSQQDNLTRIWCFGASPRSDQTIHLPLGRSQKVQLLA